ncbi:MAG: LEA type 2 family protein [Bacteroidales bacterium]|nr:LEA type 2 family protein [Bacteroidales bacterium]
MIRYIVFLMVLLLHTSCKIKEVEIGKFQNYRLVNVSENKAHIEFSVPVKNNNNFGFTIADIRLHLSINDKEIGTVKESNKIRIPAQSNTSYPVVLEVEIDKAMGNISSLTASLIKNKIGIKAQGYVKVRKFIFTKKFPVDQNETLKIF